MNNQEVYLVVKVGRGWTVYAPTGTTLDTKTTKAAAVTLAKVLAGWRGTVKIAA